MVKNKIASLLPNLTLSLNDGLFLYMNDMENVIQPTKSNATRIQNFPLPSGNFQYLLSRLADIIYNGRTTNIIPFQKYIQETNYLMPNHYFVSI